jgi:hypothetical protein
MDESTKYLIYAALWLIASALTLVGTLTLLTLVDGPILPPAIREAWMNIGFAICVWRGVKWLIWWSHEPGAAQQRLADVCREIVETIKFALWAAVVLACLFCVAVTLGFLPMPT